MRHEAEYVGIGVEEFTGDPTVVGRSREANSLSEFIRRLCGIVLEDFQELNVYGGQDVMLSRWLVSLVCLVRKTLEYLREELQAPCGLVPVG